MVKLRTIRYQLEEDLVKKAEEVFCYTEVEGVRIKVRHLNSVIREAILRGLKVMVVEQKYLRKLYNTDQVFLSETGMLFPEDLLEKKRKKEGAKTG